MSHPAAARDGSGTRVDAALRWLPALLAALAVALVGVRTGPPAGVVGVAGGAALLFATQRLSRPYPFAVGQVALVAAAGGRPPGPAVVAAELALLAVLVVPDVAEGSRRAAGATLAATAGLGAVTAAAWVTWGSVVAAAAAAAATGGLIAYGLHRIEQVRLGVIDGE